MSGKKPKALLRKAIRALRPDPTDAKATRDPLAPLREADWYQLGLDGSRDLEDWARARNAEWDARQAEVPADNDADDAADPSHDVELNTRLIDWDALASQTQSADTVSVIVPTYRDWELTTRAVQCVADAGAGAKHTVETIVVNNGCGAQASTILDSLPHRFPNVRVIHFPVNHGFALGNNLALEHTTGGTVVFLNNDTEVHPGWLEPLVAALDEPDVLGAQSLLVYPTGEIQSAGIAFPSCGGIPHPLLQGHPVEEAAGLESAAFSALTGAALAMRFADVVALRGFDPLFRNGMEDVDLGLRMLRLRPGRFTVRPESVVVHHESKTPGRYKHAMTNRRSLLDRWGTDLPGDDLELWSHAGHEVVGYSKPKHPGKEERLDAPQPILLRDVRPTVSEGFPSLRWVLKNAATPGMRGELWGDTHYARQLASALRRLGQRVAIDYRPAFERTHDPHEDVALVLRGLTPYRPHSGAVSLLWVISHPEAVTAEEAAPYDRVFAAGIPWAERTCAEWGIRIDPLLQATDPLLFHPDRSAPDTGEPILFVGSTRDQDRPVVLGAIAAGLPVSVFGPKWEGRIPDHHLKGTSVPNHELGAAYRSAGIVLNDHWEQMRVDGFVSNRLFDAVAAGARVITDDVFGLGDTFGRSVQIASGPEDLIRLTRPENFDAIYGDDDERRRVAARIHAEHSFDARARVLLDTALELRRAQPTRG